MPSFGLLGVIITIGLASTLAGLGRSANRRGDTPPQDHETAADRIRFGGKTADELLRALRRSRPVHDLLAPASEAQHAEGSQSVSAILPEGTAVVDRTGYVAKQGSWWTFVPDPATDGRVIKLLQNLNLEIMIRSSAGKSMPVYFVVSGEVTAFQGENYLLARLVRRASIPQVDPIGPPQDRSADGGNEEAAPSKTGDAGVPTAEDVIELLQKQRPTAVVHFTPAFEAPRNRNLPVANLTPDGTALEQRPGRVVRENDSWTFVFETQHAGYTEPTVKLLPSRGLELMLQSAREIDSGLVLLVSGEITQFANENYLLPRGVIRRTKSGNLRK